jgi:GNAT superfamily N-acetyltransferase
MSTVNQFFLQSLMREIFFQSIIMVSAIMFILLGVPFYWIVSSVPFVAISFYVIIWTAHFYKAHYLHPDLKDIAASYMASPNTCFFVAEAFGDPPSLLRRKANPPAFVTSVEFERMVQNGTISPGNGQIIGTIAVARDRDSAVIAWLRRTAVSKVWRNLGVGQKLLETLIMFCNQKGFVAIELVTTECHGSGRKLYEKKGFEMKQLYHKKILNLSPLAITMYFMSYKTRPSTGASGVL